MDYRLESRIWGGVGQDPRVVIVSRWKNISSVHRSGEQLVELCRENPERNGHAMTVAIIRLADGDVLTEDAANETASVSGTAASTSAGTLQ